MANHTHFHTKEAVSELWLLVLVPVCTLFAAFAVFLLRLAAGKFKLRESLCPPKEGEE